jgi:hypothetical protein
MIFAKAAYMLLSDRILPRDSKIKKATMVAIAAWGIFALFTLAFQCPVPHSWVFQPAQCATHGRLFYAIISLNLLTDLILASLIIPVVWETRMALRDRVLVVILFGLRACILAPALTEMALMHKFLGTSDQTRITVNRAILSQITVYISVLSAAIPRTNQFLSQLHTDRNTLMLPEFEIQHVQQRQQPKRESQPPTTQNESIPSTATAGNSQMSHKPGTSLLAWFSNNSRSKNRQEQEHESGI